MIVNGMLVTPPNMGNALYPDEPGYQAPKSADSDVIAGYLTEDQRNTLREASRLESCAKQQLELLDTAHRMSTASCKLGRDFFELVAMGSIYTSTLESSMHEIESAAAKLLVTLQELRYQIDNIPEWDVISHVRHDVDFLIANKRRALDWEQKANTAPDQERKGM